MRRVSHKHNPARVPVFQNTLFKVHETVAKALLPELAEDRGVRYRVVIESLGEYFLVFFGVEPSVRPRERVFDPHNPREVHAVGLAEGE